MDRECSVNVCSDRMSNFSLGNSRTHLNCYHRKREDIPFPSHESSIGDLGSRPRRRQCRVSILEANSGFVPQDDGCQPEVSEAGVASCVD